MSATRYALRRVGNLYPIAIEDYIAFAKYIARAKRAYRKKGFVVDNRTIKELAVELTVTITAVCDGIKGRSVFTNQLLRSCSSIGANAQEARYAQSRADFISKLEIALKECYETEYWIEILYKVKSIDEITYKGLLNKSGTIRRMLIASIQTVKSKREDY